MYDSRTAAVLQTGGHLIPGHALPCPPGQAWGWFVPLPGVIITATLPLAKAGWMLADDCEPVPVALGELELDPGEWRIAYRPDPLS